MIAGLSQAIKLQGLPIWSLHDGQAPCDIDALPLPIAADDPPGTGADGRVLDPVAIDVNVFLFQGPLGLTLVDAGTGSACGPQLGMAPGMLQATGFACEAIDAILMTHLHVDHAAGLCDEGEPLYPNATLFVGRLEASFWAGDGPSGRQSSQTGFAREALAAYQDRLRLIDHRDELAPGLTAQALHGHTPGMMGFQADFATAAVLFCGDISHALAPPVPRRGWSHVLDIDPAAADRTRRATLQRAAANQVVLAGAHLPFPGVGTVDAAGDGFVFWPWQGQVPRRA